MLGWRTGDGSAALVRPSSNMIDIIEVTTIEILTNLLACDRLISRRVMAVPSSVHSSPYPLLVSPVASKVEEVKR